MPTQVKVTPTQKDQILKLLTPSKKRKFPTLTQEEARTKHGIKSLSSRVRELRDDGFPILSQTFVRKVDGKTLVRYALAV